MILDPVGEAGQARLAASHAAVVGCGALGCVAADLLVRAGVGRLTLIDRDTVEWTNLQRQILFDEADARQRAPKAVCAANRLRAINSSVSIGAEVADVTHRNLDRLLPLVGDGAAGVVVDGTDNVQTRYLLNDAVVRAGGAWVYGGAVASRGMVMPIIAGRTACLRCVFEEPPGAATLETCDTAGVWGPVVSIVGAAQADLALKILMGAASSVSPSLLEFDLWESRRRRLSTGGPRPECPCCGERRFEFLDGRGSQDSVALCGQNAYQVHASQETRIDLNRLALTLSRHGEFRASSSMVRGAIGAERGVDGGEIELTVFGDGRAIVRGVASEHAARAVYARFVGN
ncbi:MAG: ThiF family adenylyltransferase [Phycisphaeraceae bacterium]|nr:ThiF family adenylyltransferase [Phycisphaeraceae bacterium]